jgi:hypothetical protein
MSTIGNDAMIKKITTEIDKSILAKRDNPRLSELIVSVIADPQNLPKDFVDLCFGIHEFETDTTSDIDEAKKFNLKTYQEFSSFLAALKEKFIWMWE